MRAWLALQTMPRLTVGLSAALCALIASSITHCPRSSLADRPGFDAAAAYLSTQNVAGPLFVVVWPPGVADAMHALPTPLRVADAVPDATTRGGQRLALIGPAGFAAPPELEGVEAEPRHRFEEVEVAVYRYEAKDAILFDLRHDLSETSVFLVSPEGRLACGVPRTEGGFGCPGRPDWNYVGPTRLRVGGRDWAGVWAHPVQGHDLVIALGDRPLGDTLEVEAALSDNAVLTQGAATVQIEVDIGGVTKKTLRRSNSAGVATLTVDTPRRTAPVTLTIRTGADARRHLAINLRIIERAEEAP